MTGVQTLVPIMLDHVNAGRLSLLRASSTSPAPGRRGCSASPRKGRIAVGYDADLTVVDLKRRETITDGWIASRAGWTPYDGVTRDRLAGRHLRARPQGDVAGRTDRRRRRARRAVPGNLGSSATFSGSFAIGPSCDLPR